MNRGSDTVSRHVSWRQGASMRPRFMNRGSAQEVILRTFDIGLASMRPRFMNRGSQKKVMGIVRERGLQ